MRVHRRNFRDALGNLKQTRSIALALSLAALCTAPLQAQQTQEAPTEEFVANLAAGRVVIAVVKDSIVIATVENPIEVQTHVPAPVPVSSLRAEIMLGAVDWEAPSAQMQLARLDTELPHLRGGAPIRPGTSLTAPQSNAEATDLEGVGQAIFERFNEVTKDIHGKITLPKGEPIAQLVVAGYAKDYGPEIWLLTFDVKQDMQREDYFNTHITRPTYFQYWPPEKGEPHTLVEFQYPPENPTPTVQEMLRNKDPRIQALISSDAKMAQVASLFVAGDSKKILGADAIQFLRAILTAIAPTARQTVSVLTEDNGFQWVLKPPAEPKPKSVSTAVSAATDKDRPAEAPSLLHPN